MLMMINYSWIVWPARLNFVPLDRNVFSNFEYVEVWMFGCLVTNAKRAFDPNMDHRKFNMATEVIDWFNCDRSACAKGFVSIRYEIITYFLNLHLSQYLILFRFHIVAHIPAWELPGTTTSGAVRSLSALINCTSAVFINSDNWV